MTFGDLSGSLKSVRIKIGECMTRIKCWLFTLITRLLKTNMKYTSQTRIPSLFLFLLRGWNPLRIAWTRNLKLGKLVKSWYVCVKNSFEAQAQTRERGNQESGECLRDTFLPIIQREGDGGWWVGWAQLRSPTYVHRPIKIAYVKTFWLTWQPQVICRKYRARYELQYGCSGFVSRWRFQSISN